MRSWIDRLLRHHRPATTHAAAAPPPFLPWRRVQEALHAALEEPPAKRDALLDRLCAGEPALRREVESLLEAHETTSLLDRSAADVLAPLAFEITADAGLAPGAGVGRYTIEEKLATGGMGVLYRAHDPRLGRMVALKFLPPHLTADPEAKQRFLHEARAAAALDHPNICAIHEIADTEGGELFIVMPLYEGETLKERIGRGPLAVEDAVDLALQAARGLTSAHRRGIVHRDIKPSNLIVTSDGTLKILDFGIAKLADVELTGRGSTPGTVAYMSPEQAASGAVDHRTDLWSLGVVLYEMLAGARPFQGEHEQVLLHGIRYHRHEPLAARCPALPPEVARIVEKTLRKDPADRFQNAHELALALRAARDGRGVASIESARRRTRATGLAAAVVLTGVLVLGLASGGGDGSRGPGAERTGPAVAVLPFANLGGQADDDYLSEGMTEDILAQLATIERLRVISRTSTARYRDTELPLARIAAELGVSYVLEGSVRRSVDEFRVVAQLIDARTDEHLWAATYDGRLDDVLGLQSEIALQVARALDVSLSRAERRRLARPPTDAPRAYDLLLRARALVGRGMTENETAVALLQDAIRQDPGFAEAHARLARVYLHRVDQYGFPRSWVDSAEGLARRAVELDRDDPAGSLALVAALHHRGRWSEVLAMLEDVVASNPNHAEAFALRGSVERRVGRLDDAIFSLHRALQLDPAGSWPAANQGSMYWLLDDWAEAEHWFSRASELDHPGIIPATLRVLETAYTGRHAEAREQARVLTAARPEPWAVYTAGQVALLAGEWREALDHFAPLYEREPGWRPFEMFPSAAVRYALALLRLGHTDRARAILEEARLHAHRDLEAGNEGFALLIDVAMVHALMGDRQAALEWLEQARAAGARDHRGLRLDPAFAELRTEPAFQDALARMQDEVRRMRLRVAEAP
jgi:TolB-like protein/Flp pilus assembly protein TadD